MTEPGVVAFVSDSCSNHCYARPDVIHVGNFGFACLVYVETKQVLRLCKDCLAGHYREKHWTDGSYSFASVCYLEAFVEFALNDRTKFFLKIVGDVRRVESICNRKRHCLDQYVIRLRAVFAHQYHWRILQRSHTLLLQTLVH